MKNEFNIDTIRVLLQKYYEAAISAEEELLLEKFFLNTPENKIPEDLLQDRMLLMAMNALHPDLTDLEIPETLVKEMQAFPQGVKASRPNRKRRLVYASIAAAIAAVVAVGINLLPDRTSKQDPVGHSATLTDDGYIEITDPEEAERIALEIGRLLATNSQKTDEAISRISVVFDEYKEMSKSSRNN